MIRLFITLRDIGLKRIFFRLRYEFFSKIDSKDPDINSYICTTNENAILQAENIDKLIQNNEILPPLAGMTAKSFLPLIFGTSSNLIFSVSTEYLKIFDKTLDLFVSPLRIHICPNE